MKKLFFLFSICFILFSCSSDDNKSGQVDNSWVYGRWNVTGLKTSENGSWTISISDGWYAQFNSDGTYSSVFSGTYTMNGNTIICKVGSETVIYNILERNGNNAVAKMSYASAPNDYVWFKLEKK